MEIDIRYSLSLLKKIKNLAVRGEPISAVFNRIYSSAWASKQFYLLTQIKEYSRYKNFEAYTTLYTRRVTFINRLNIFFAASFVIFVSTVALMRLFISNVTVLTFEADRIKEGTRYSPRLFKVFMYLEAQKVNYIECVHAAQGVSLLRNLFTRRRPVIYIEALDSVYKLLTFLGVFRRSIFKAEGVNYDAFTEDESIFVQHLLQNTFESVEYSAFRVRSLIYILKKSSIKHFISIDDVRYMYEIIGACRACGVTSHIFQHSNFDYLTGLDQLDPSEYPFPDRFYLWNEYWRDRLPILSRLFDHYKARFEIAERTYLFEQVECLPLQPVTEDGEIVVLIPYEIALTGAQIQPFIRVLLSEPRVKILLQLRGDVPSDEQCMKYLGSSSVVPSQVRIVPPKEKSVAFREAHLVMGVYSGFLDEAIEMCRPVLVFDTEYPIFNSLIEDGLANNFSRDFENVYTELLKWATIQHTVLSERRTRSMRGGGSLERTLDRILIKEENTRT